MRGGGEVIELVLSWIVTTGLSFLIVLLDERWMSEAKLERAWPPPSRDAALIAFGVLALPIHFIKTRGHLRSVRGILGFPLGLAMGVLAVVFVGFVGSLVLEGVARLTGLPVE
jgi:hypothetical protein